MALGRVWIPSPNYSSSRPHNQILVVHTSEGATTFRNLGNYLAQASSEVSYHVGFDNTTRDEIGEYVKPDRKSWSAHSANSYGEHGCCCTPSGAANGWSRDDWLARPLMLDACGAWLREEGARYGIPLVKINGDQIAAGVKGVCMHKDCVDAGLGGNHTDCGPHFPWDVVLGDTPKPQPPPEVRDMWTTHKDLEAGTGRDDKTSIQIGLPAGRKNATVTLYTGANPPEGASLWGAIGYQGKKQGLWGGGNTWEMWLPGQQAQAITLPNSAQSIEIQHMGGTKAALAITISGE